MRTPQPVKSWSREQALGDRAGLVVVDDPRPQAMAHVGGARVDGSLVGVEGEREVPPVGEPEPIVELALQVRRPLVPLGSQPVVAAEGRDRRTGEEGGIHVALHLAERDGCAGEGPVGEGDAVPRVLPALVDEPVLVESRVLHESVAVAVAVAEDPLERPIGRLDEVVGIVGKAAPACELAEDDDEERRGIRRAVVHRAAAEREVGRGAEPHLVEDASRLLLGCGIHSGALQFGEGAERAEGERGVDRQRHQRGEQRVSTEQGHEPRCAGSDDGAVGMRGVEDAQGAEVELALQDDAFDRVVLERGHRDAGLPGEEAVRARGPGAKRHRNPLRSRTRPDAWSASAGSRMTMIRAARGSRRTPVGRPECCAGRRDHESEVARHAANRPGSLRAIPRVARCGRPVARPSFTSKMSAKSDSSTSSTRSAIGSRE